MEKKMKKVFCKDCTCSTYKMVKELKNDWLHLPTREDIYTEVPKLHCAFNPKWRQVEEDHFCYQGVVR